MKINYDITREELTKEFISLLLNKHGTLNSNYTRKLTNVSTEDLYLIYNSIEKPLCECCSSPKQFLNFRLGYQEICSNPKCTLRLKMINDKVSKTRLNREIKTYICSKCGKEIKSKSNILICESCKKENRKLKILEETEPCDYNHAKKVIIELLTKYKPDHITEPLMKSHPDVFVFLSNYTKINNYSKITESMYLIINDISEKPRCKCGCGEYVAFRSINKGYNTYSPDPNCKYLDSNYKDKLNKSQREIHTIRKIERHKGEYTYWNGIYKNMNSILEYFKRSPFNRSTDNNYESLEEFDKEVPFYDFIEPEDLNKRFYYFKNGLTKPKLCHTCGSEVTNYQLDYCSIGCVNRDPNIREKISKTNLEKYGVEYYSQTNTHKNKIRDFLVKSRNIFSSKEANNFFKELKEKLDKRIRIDDMYFSEYSKEYFLRSKEKIYFYDFCIPSLKIIVEYNGTHVHPNINMSKEEWDKWRNPFTKECADTVYKKDLRKAEFAKNKGFSIYFVWSNENKEESLNRLFNIIINSYKEKEL